MTPIIEFREVTKCYRRRGFSGGAPDAPPRRQDICALQDVSFSVEPGESLGIIGFNGAGKSTALKLIAGITTPTHGRVCREGRVTALIELGAGFHPDLSGRENVHLSAAMYGLKRKDIRQRFDSIVDFAEIADFLDMPVKHYSTGMQARLAFSVAVHGEPDILLVDEVLSVGDAPFQVRCMERIQELRNNGTTLIFVSHYLGLVVDACERAIFLDQGHVQFMGSAQETVNRYLDAQRSGKTVRPGTVSSQIGTRSGSYDVEIDSVRLLNEEGQTPGTWDMGSAMTVRIEYMTHRPIVGPVFGVEITRNDGLDCFATNTKWDEFQTGKIMGRGIAELHIPRLNLTAGSYSIGVGILEQTGTAFLDFHDRAYPFEVQSPRKHRGTTYLEHHWRLRPHNTGENPAGGR